MRKYRDLICLLLVQMATAFVVQNTNVLTLPNNSCSSSKRTQVSVLTDPSSDAMDMADDENFDIITDRVSDNTRPEYICLQPGSNLQIRIGDLTASRKAWKKRRRSGSPILLPCSILSMDRMYSVRCNLKYLVLRYGRDLGEKYGGGRGGAKGIAVTMNNMVYLWSKKFGSSLEEKADELGYDGVESLLLSLFPSDDGNSTTNRFSTTQQNQGVFILQTDNDNPMIYIPSTTIRRGRIQASNSPVIQMTSHPSSSSSSSEDSPTEIHHTGYILRPSIEKNEVLPLSAALRISSNNALTHMKQGQIVSSHVFQYDPTGDNDNPLLVLTLDPPKTSKFNDKQNLQMKLRKNKLENMDSKVELMFENLHIGDGPLKGNIRNISSRSRAAFVDIGVGRKRGKNRGGGVEKILGMLRFDDMLKPIIHSDDNLEDEGYEIVEDVTDMFEIDENLDAIFSVDSDTGEKNFIGSLDEDEDEDEEEGVQTVSEDNFKGLNAEERLLAIEKMLSDEEETSNVNHAQSDIPSVTSMCVGDEIEVYISSVFPQSKRFMVTLSKPILSIKQKDVKSQKVANKRLSKLEDDGTLQKMTELIGVECNGVVKAVSKTGDWFYVAPDVAKEENIPQVGVARPVYDSESIDLDIVAGTTVRVRLEGVEKGQLLMSLLGKEE